MAEQDETTEVVAEEPRDEVPAEEPKPRFATIQPGDNLATFAERHGVDVQELVRLNERELANQAQARGHAHTYRYTVQDENGRQDSYTGYHVFHGEELRLRSDEE